MTPGTYSKGVIEQISPKRRISPFPKQFKIGFLSPKRAYAQIDVKAKNPIKALSSENRFKKIAHVVKDARLYKEIVRDLIS